MFPRRLIVPAALGLALVARAAAAQPPDEAVPGLADPDAEVSLAMQAVQSCMVTQAKAADDGVSNPGRIAARIKDDCGAEQARLMAASTDYAARHPGFQGPPPLLSDSDRFDAARAVVIQLRKEARKSH